MNILNILYKMTGVLLGFVTHAHMRLVDISDRTVDVLTLLFAVRPFAGVESWM